MPLNERPKPYRDARLFVLVLEGEKTGAEYLYFDGLRCSSLIDSRKVNIELIPTPQETHRSSPADVLRRAVDAMSKVDDKLVKAWLVIDVDRWSESVLGSVCQEALENDMGVAISNPCFELWLLLHEEDVSADDLGRVHVGKRSRAIQTRLGAIRHARHGVRPPLTEQLLGQAAKRARALTRANGQGWPEYPGTFVYCIVDELAQAGVLKVIL